MTEPLLKVQGLQTFFQTGAGTARAVDGAEFAINRGEVFAVLGESGCGKSMTALSIMRLVPEPAGRIAGGRILLDGTDLLTLPEAAMRDVRGSRIAMIFQEPMTSLNPVLPVGLQIGETVERHMGLRGRALRERVLELLNAVGIPAPVQRYDEYPHQLSGGMKQRVMIAIALAGDPELLIADEPTTALDVTIQAQILDLLRRLQAERNMAVMLITHDLGVVSEMADRVAVMYAGHIVEQAARADFFANPQHPYSRKLFESLPTMGKRNEQLAVIRGSVPSLTRELPACRFEERCDFAWRTCRELAPRWTPAGAGHYARCHLIDPAVEKPESVRQKADEVAVIESAIERNADVLLETRDMKVWFPIQKGLFKRTVGYVRAVDGVSLALRVGQTLALVGESGCGKTTAGKGILQLIRPTGGDVRFDDRELTNLSSRRMRPYRSEMQIIFQDPYSSMNPRMMIADIIEEGMIAQRIGSTAADRQTRIDELLVQVGLSPEIKQRYPHEFSGGQRQRICIARALAVGPKLIICDEPTSALDVSVQAQILNLLKTLQGRLGLTYLFITHNLSVVEYLAHEVAVMYLGRIVERGAVEEVMSNPRHPYTQALLSAIPQVDTGTGRQVIRLQGDLPSPSDPPPGCHFHPRCPQVMDVCRGDYPGRTDISDTHMTHCYLYGPGSEKR